MSDIGRHEYKHYINTLDYYLLRAKLKALMKRDPNSNPNGKYFIRSLYFDNDCNKVLLEKLDGIDNRDKYRIRNYNKNHNLIHLEKKSKKNGRCFKTSVSITKKESEKILSNDLEWLKESKSELLRELYIQMGICKMRPKTIVDYEREAYIYEPGNIRITFDSNVRTGIYNTDIFNNDIATVPAIEDYIILEVKYDQYLPETISNIIQLGNRRNLSVSKYTLCRIYG